MSPRLRRWFGPVADEAIQASAWLRWRARTFALWLPAVGWHRPVVRGLILGLPAVAAATAIGTVAVSRWANNRAALIAEYRAEASRAFAAEQFQEARVRYERLAAVAAESDDIYQLARCYDALGQADRAGELVHRIAPEDATGHPDAHLRLALELLAEKSPGATRRAAGHLLRAVETRPNFAVAQALLAQLHLAAGNKFEASQHLAEAVASHPELALSLAQIAATQGNADTTGRWATAAIAHFAPIARSRPTDADAQLHYAEALYLARRYAEAAKVARAALKRADDPRLRQLVVDIYVAWSAGPAGELTGDRLTRIEEGLSINPESGPLLQALAAATGGNTLPALAAKRIIERRLADTGSAGSAAHLAVGIEALKRGDAAAARKHLERAHELNPSSPIIANNLAWVLANGPNPDLANALKYADAALGRLPDEPNLRDTRGQILAKLGRWQEAIRDLEFALIRVPPNRDTHVALAQAYRALNLPTLADLHGQKAEATGR